MDELLERAMKLLEHAQTTTEIALAADLVQALNRHKYNEPKEKK